MRRRVDGKLKKYRVFPAERTFSEYLGGNFQTPIQLQYKDGRRDNPTVSKPRSFYRPIPCENDNYILKFSGTTKDPNKTLKPSAKMLVQHDHSAMSTINFCTMSQFEQVEVNPIRFYDRAI